MLNLLQFLKDLIAKFKKIVQAIFLAYAWRKYQSLFKKLFSCEGFSKGENDLVSCLNLTVNLIQSITNFFEGVMLFGWTFEEWSCDKNVVKDMLTLFKDFLVLCDDVFKECFTIFVIEPIRQL